MYTQLRLTKINFCSIIPEAGFFQYQKRHPTILNLIHKIFRSFCVAVVEPLKWSFIFLYYKSAKLVLLPHHQYFWILQCFLVGFALQVFTTIKMLRKCTQAFLVQTFYNFILKGNTIVVGSCPMSHAFLASSIFQNWWLALWIHLGLGYYFSICFMY